MAAIPQASDESFSYAWLNNMKQSMADFLDETLTCSFDAASFIDIDPDFFSMRWNRSADFDFEISNGDASLAVNADQIFVDGHLLPLPVGDSSMRNGGSASSSDSVVSPSKSSVSNSPSKSSISISPSSFCSFDQIFFDGDLLSLPVGDSSKRNGGSASSSDSVVSPSKSSISISPSSFCSFDQIFFNGDLLPVPAGDSLKRNGGSASSSDSAASPSKSSISNSPSSFCSFYQIFFNGDLLPLPVGDSSKRNGGSASSSDSVFSPSKSSISNSPSSFYSFDSVNGIEKPRAKSSAKMLRKYFNFLLPLYKKFNKRLKMISSKFPRSCDDSSRSSASAERRRCCRVFDVKPESSIHDAVLHCKKSNDSSNCISTSIP